MCRKSHMQGCCCVCLGLGLMLGHSLTSWFLCCCGGIALVVFGMCVLCRRR